MFIRREILILFLFIMISGVIAEQQYSGHKWDVQDIAFKTEKRLNNPFEISLWTVFIHENGTMMNIPGFYDGNNTWIVRFCPPLPGKWTFQTASSFPDLAGHKGVLNAGPNVKNDEHGPVIVSKTNPQKFVYADGTPYFLLAFELDWLFALDWDNRADIPKSKHILDIIDDHGFNHIVMNVYAYDAAWRWREIEEKFNFAKPEVFPFGGSNEHPDYSTLNVDFFKHFDRVIAYMDEKEIVSHLMIYVWNKMVNWPEPGSQADNLYFDYVVKRYQAFPNLVWDISKEALAYGRDDMDYISGRIKRLQQLDGHNRLISVHDYQYCRAFPEYLDFISIQEWRPNIYDEMRRVAGRHPKKPILNIEHGGYEKSMHSVFDGAYNDPLVCLDRNYQCVFAGTYSTYYWQNIAWYEVVTTPFGLPVDNRPKFAYYKHLSELFQRYSFNRLEPAQFGFTTYCLTNEDDLYLFYLPDGLIKVAGTVSSLKGKAVKPVWFDPLKGRYSSDKKKIIKNKWLSFIKPSHLKEQMAVLILEVLE